MRRLLLNRWCRRFVVAWRNTPLARQAFFAFYGSMVVVTAATFVLYIQDTRRSVVEMERSTMRSMFPVIERVIMDSMVQENHDPIRRLFALHNGHGHTEGMFLLDPEKNAINTDDMGRSRQPRHIDAPPVDEENSIVME